MTRPKKKSRQLNTYAKPKLVKKQVKFPYSRYKIDWCDIVTEGGWGSEKEFNNMKLATPVSEGYLFSKDDKTVKILLVMILMMMVRLRLVNVLFFRLLVF